MQSRPSRHSSRERGRTVQARGESPWPVGEEIDGRGMVPIPNLPSSMCLGTGSYCIEVPAASGAGFMRSNISRISRFVSRRPWQMAARPQDSHRKPARSSSDPTPVSPAWKKISDGKHRFPVKFTVSGRFRKRFPVKFRIFRFQNLKFQKKL